MHRAFALLCLVLSIMTITPTIASAQPKPGRGELLAGTKEPVVRFVSEAFTGDDVLATFALKQVWAAAGPAPAAFPVQPLFEKTADNKHRVVINAPPGTSFYGTGEVGGPLLRNGRTVTLWNTDAYGYNADSSPLYKSHPYVLAVLPDGSSFGVLADSTWRMTIALDGKIDITAEGRPFPVYIWKRSSPQEATKTLAELTGTMPLPPRWAIGYHQCRYSYYPEARVREVASGFRDRKIPASVLWFDIDYMDGYRTFTFDKSHFPDPKKLNDDLGAQGWKRIWMINPGVKDEKGFFVRDQLADKGYEVKTKDGRSYRGAVWPGMCLFPDFSNHEVRAWWAGLYKDFMAQGVDGVWNDMNEPAIFNVASKTMPEDVQHRGGVYQQYPNSYPQVVTPGDHARFHNVYGMLMSQATYDGIKAANPAKRPFVLTRAGFLGSHRYVASWTGDNTADWLHMEMSVPMSLNLGLSGWAFTGPDIGGFISNGPNSFEGERGSHFARWMGVGTLLPFARGHTGKGNINKEPWEFGPEVQRAASLALERRYRLMPFLYTLFHEASTVGLPVARPLFFADPKDPALRSEDDAFLLGDSVLVVAQMMPDSSRQPVMPSGTWRRFDLVEGTHPDLPKIFLRAGHILPAGPAQQFTDEKPLDPLTLFISLDANGQARGTLYEDAGEGFGFQRDEFLITNFLATTVGDTLEISIQSQSGRMPRPERELRVRVITDNGVIALDGAREGSKVVVPLK
jgi:alpha-glucosidase